MRGIVDWVVLPKNKIKFFRLYHDPWYLSQYLLSKMRGQNVTTSNVYILTIYFDVDNAKML